MMFQILIEMCSRPSQIVVDISASIGASAPACKASYLHFSVWRWIVISAIVSQTRYDRGLTLFAQPAFQRSPPHGFRLPPQAAAMAKYQALHAMWDQPLCYKVIYNEARCYLDDEAVVRLPQIPRFGES